MRKFENHMQVPPELTKMVSNSPHSNIKIDSNNVQISHSSPLYVKSRTCGNRLVNVSVESTSKISFDPSEVIHKVSESYLNSFCSK